jgi:spore germination protein GerM
MERQVLKVQATRKPAEVVERSPEETASVKIWFIKEKDGQLEYVPVERSVSAKEKLKATVEALCQGPTGKEVEIGLASEIPKGTKVIDTKPSADGIELNLSKEFSSDGGSESIETRLEQLGRTVSDAAQEKVFLDVEGKRLSEAGGEGIEVRQPLNM